MKKNTGLSIWIPWFALEKPKIMAFAPQMRLVIARILKITPGRYFNQGNNNRKTWLYRKGRRYYGPGCGIVEESGLITFAPMSILVKIINQSIYPLPAYATSGSAGMDLKANIPEPICFRPMERKLIPTGIFIELPLGYEAQIRPRSGLALKQGITCLNSPGTVDADYQGRTKSNPDQSFRNRTDDSSGRPDCPDGGE